MKPEICQKCPAYNCDGPVGPKFHEDVRVVFVGEAPGGDEIRTREPFTGAAGGLLWMMAGRVGLRRYHTVLINAARCITKDPLAFRYCWEHFGKHDLAKVPEDVPIIALGNEAKDVIAPQLRGIGITKVRGSRIGRVTFALHPSYIRRTGRFMSKSEGESGGEKQDLAPTLAYDIASALDKRVEIVKVYNMTIPGPPPGEKHLSGDLETAMCLDPRDGPVDQIGFAWDRGKCMREKYTEAHRQLYQQVLETRVIAWHNAPFDVPYLEYYGYNIPYDNWECTLHAAHLLHPDFPLGLEFQNTLYSHYLPWKGSARRDPYTYHATDLDVGWQVWEGQELELRSTGLMSLYRKETKPVARLCMDLSKRGIKIDLDMMGRMYIAWSKRIEQVEAALYKIAPMVDFNSPQQVAALLYDALHLPTKWKKDQFGNQRRTTDAEALEELLEETNHPVLKLLLAFRGLCKQRDTYLNYRTDDKGFWHFDLSFTTSTGRARGFLLTMPRGVMRRVFIPDEPGWKIAAADLNRVELWISAITSGDKEMQRVLRETNFHAFIGSQAFNMEVKKGMPEYEQSKHITHGYNFKRSDRAIAKGHDIPLDRVQTMLRAIDRQFPVWYRHRERRIEQAYSEGYLENAFGFKRYFWSGNIPSMAASFDPQSDVAHIIKRISLQLQHALPKPARLVFPFHDATMTTYPAEMEEEVKRIQLEAMTQAWDELGGWHADSDFKSGANLEEAT